MDDVRETGAWAWFEYHCWQDFDSADADLWIRSWRPVEVLGLGECEVVEDLTTMDDRMDAGMPLSYRVRFPDGKEKAVFEDELLDSPAAFTVGLGPPTTADIVAGYAPPGPELAASPIPGS